MPEKPRGMALSATDAMRKRQLVSPLLGRKVGRGLWGFVLFFFFKFFSLFILFFFSGLYSVQERRNGWFLCCCFVL